VTYFVVYMLFGSLLLSTAALTEEQELPKVGVARAASISIVMAVIWLPAMIATVLYKLLHR